MKDLVLVGSGGFFLEICDYFQNDLNKEYIHNVRIKGVIDDYSGSPLEYIDFLGKISEYRVKSNDIFLICIGSPLVRDQLFEQLKKKGAKFYTYIHPSAVVANSATLGEGVIICPYAIVNAESEVADNVLLNINTSVGHQAYIGKSSVLSPYAAVNGSGKLGQMCFLGSRSTVFPCVSIGNKTIVDSHSYAKYDAGEKKIVSLRGDYLCVNNRLMR